MFIELGIKSQSIVPFGRNVWPHLVFEKSKGTYYKHHLFIMKKKSKTENKIKRFLASLEFDLGSQ